MLGSETMRPEHANSLYEQARFLLTRYDPQSSFDPTQVDGDIDKITHVIRGSGGRVIGVVRGDVFDRDVVIKDMVRVASIRGLLGELVADLNTALAKGKKALERLEMTVYNDYTSMVNRKDTSNAAVAALIESAEGKAPKLTKDNIQALVTSDDRIAEMENKVLDTQRNRERAVNLQDGLLGLENALKKALEYGDKAQ